MELKKKNDSVFFYGNTKSSNELNQEDIASHMPKLH
jgi:hypothetical protein